MKPERIADAFKALIQEGETVKATQYHDLLGQHVNAEMGHRWASNAVALIRSTFGEASDLYARAKKHAQDAAGFHDSVALLATVCSSLDVWERGYMFDMRELAEAAVEASLMDQAQDLLANNYYQPAAVLAGAVLEQHLRSVALSHGIGETDANGRPKTMNPLNVELCKAGVYDKTRQKHIDLLAGIRNEAAHGKPVDAEHAKRIVEDVIDLCAKLK